MTQKPVLLVLRNKKHEARALTTEVSSKDYMDVIENAQLSVMPLRITDDVPREVPGEEHTGSIASAHSGIPKPRQISDEKCA